MIKYREFSPQGIYELLEKYIIKSENIKYIVEKEKDRRRGRDRFIIYEF